MAVQSLEPQDALKAQCSHYLARAFQTLNISIREKDCVELSTLVLQPMVGPWRFFHTFEHVLMVGGSGDPLEMLAGAFHDLVYIQVDTGIPFNLAGFLTTTIQEIDGKIQIRTPLAEDSGVVWLLDLFNLQPGQILNSLRGQNEFLSALVAVKALEPHLGIRERLAIAVCIEATIPFRVGERAEGLPEATLAKLQRICRQHALPISPTEQIEMIRRGVRVANRDVMGFAKPSAAHFLADTWNLLPENNHQFSPGGHHQVAVYRKAIVKTEDFFQEVRSPSIFRSFRGTPPPSTLQHWQAQAHHNLAVGRLYLTCKFVAITLLEALAQPFGSQTTLEFWMGNLPEHDHMQAPRLEDFFPPRQRPSAPLSTIEEEVWLLLAEGRAASSYQGDLVNSPLATFLLQFHDFGQLPQQRQAAKHWLAGSLSHYDFLEQFNPQFLRLLIGAIHQLWTARQQTIDTYFSGQFETPVHSESTGWARRLAMRSQ